MRIDWEGEREDDEERPQRGRAGQDSPRDDEPREHGGRDETAPQVVENLPARNERQPIAHRVPARVGHTGQEPAGYLPVAARPAVLAFGEGVVVRDRKSVV